MKVLLLDDQEAGTQFPVHSTGGIPKVGSTFVTHGEGGADIRVYIVTAIKGDTLTVERQLICAGMYAFPPNDT